jgi:hypothetical protein
VPNNEYIYDYEGQAVTGLPASSRTVSGLKIQAKLKIQVKDAGEYILKVSQVLDTMFWKPSTPFIAFVYRCIGEHPPKKKNCIQMICPSQIHMPTRGFPWIIHSGILKITCKNTNKCELGKLLILFLRGLV